MLILLYHIFVQKSVGLHKFLERILGNYICLAIFMFDKCKNVLDTLKMKYVAGRLGQCIK